MEAYRNIDNDFDEQDYQISKITGRQSAISWQMKHIGQEVDPPCNLGRQPFSNIVDNVQESSFGPAK